MFLLHCMESVSEWRPNITVWFSMSVGRFQHLSVTYVTYRFGDKLMRRVPPSPCTVTVLAQ
jgi:hypothetical protein